MLDINHYTIQQDFLLGDRICFISANVKAPQSEERPFSPDAAWRLLKIQNRIVRMKWMRDATGLIDLDPSKVKLKGYSLTHKRFLCFLMDFRQGHTSERFCCFEGIWLLWLEAYLFRTTVGLSLDYFPWWLLWYVRVRCWRSARSQRQDNEGMAILDQLSSTTSINSSTSLKTRVEGTGRQWTVVASWVNFIFPPGKWIT